MADSKSLDIESIFAEFRPMEPVEALVRIRALVQTEPNFRIVGDDGQVLTDTLKWLGQLAALTDAMKLTSESVQLSVAERLYVQSRGSSGAPQIRSVLYRVLARAELNAPAAAQGTFVAAGNQVDAYGAIAQILATSQSRILIIDPYLDATLVTDFLAAAPATVQICVLSDEATVKETLLPAATRWIAQHGTSRPLEVRFAAGRTLHDRLIIVDELQVWTLTQSIKDFAKRSHASAFKIDNETGQLKINAYNTAWESAKQVL